MNYSDTPHNLTINKDAFSSGQIGSKIWLCEQLENLFASIDNIWIYGGWYGLTGFLLKSRGKIEIKTIRSFDKDPSCEPIADMINENWVWRDWQFKAETKDVVLLNPSEHRPDLIINTSTEHFDDLLWWQKIPTGTVVALQGNNMPHDDHVVHTANLEEFQTQFPLTDILYKGQLEFEYPDWKFTRFMLIGVK